MATYGGQDYTNFRAVNLRGSVGVRLSADPSAGTLSASQIEADRAWRLPDKSGTIPVAGTFAVQFAANISAASSRFSTIATVTGIRTEDGLVVFPNFRGNTGGYQQNTTMYILDGATPGAGNITLWFTNLGNGTGYMESVFSSVAVR